MTDPFRTIRPFPAAAPLLLAACLAGPAAATATVEPPKVSLVLSGGPPDADGAYRAAVSIRLAPGWHTYWRNPGDSGIPPTFDAAASANLADLAPRFPAPERWSDGVDTSITYHGDVLLPILLRPSDPAAPVRLDLTVHFGYCRDICVPGEARLTADLAPDAPRDPEAAARIAAALARVPQPEAPGRLPAVAAIEPDGPDAYRVVVAAEPGTADRVDLFVEPPDGWYIPQPEPLGAEGARALFRLSLDGKPRKAAAAGAKMRFTVTTPDGGTEAVRALP